MMGAIMFGQGSAGIVCNILMMICLAALPPEEGVDDDKNEFYGCLIYFSIATLILVLCIVFYFTLMKTNYAQFYIRRAAMAQREEKKSIITRHSMAASMATERVNMTEESGTQIEATTESLDEPDEPEDFKYIYKKVFPMSSQVFLAFFLTFIVYPGVCTQTHFKFIEKKGDAWNTLMFLVIFNVFDTIGRFGGGAIRLFTPKTVIFLTVGRAIFVVTFFLVAFNKLFQADWFRALNMAAFAITNGYNSTLLMTFGPMLVKDEHKERAGIIMAYNLVGGIFIGSLVAFGIGKINFPE